MEQARLTITGDRQAGKTYLAVLYAVTEAYQGKRVLWQGCDSHYTMASMQDAIEIAQRLHLETSRISRTNGASGMTFPSGGEIHFRPPARNAIRGRYYDLHILDDPAMWRSRGEEPQGVGRVVETVCQQPPRPRRMRLLANAVLHR